MKILVPIVTLLFTLSQTITCQNLHHQMISSQGISVQISNEIYVNQTIGQQGLIGSYNSNNIFISQGYQQAFWNVLMNDVNSSSVTTTTYPNPFFDIVNFRFSLKKLETVKIVVYDLLGRIVHQESKSLNNSVLSIDLLRLPDAEYLVKLTGLNYTYHTKIIKK